MTRKEAVRRLSELDALGWQGKFEHGVVTLADALEVLGLFKFDVDEEQKGPEK